MSNNQRIAAAICSTFVLLATIGCGGGGFQPVSGTVSIKGGKPLTKGMVRFTKVDTGKATSAVGDIDAQGNFQLSSVSKNDGALPGDYTVTLSGTEIGGGYDKPGEPQVKPAADKYDTDKTTDLKFTVKPGKNVAKLELDPK